MTLQEILDEGIYVNFYKVNDRYFLKLYKFDTKAKLKIQTERIFNSNEWLYIHEILNITYNDFIEYEHKREEIGDEILGGTE